MTNKGKWGPTIEIMKSTGIPLYDFSETAAKALIAMRNYTNLTQRPKPTYPKLEVDTKKARGIIQGAAGKKMLSGADVFELLKCYGIPTTPTVSAEESKVVDAASKLKFPLVLKIDDEAVIHKTDEGGVALGLKDKAALTSALSKMASKFGNGKHYVVQEMAPAGKEVIMGANLEGNAGHALMFGLGGIFVEVLKDVSFKLNPLSEQDAEASIKAIKGYPILEGMRGQEGVDVVKLKDVMLRLSKLLSDNPEIKEMDLNPIFAYPKGQSPKVVDARVRI
jgi:acetyltransferase